MPPSSRMLRSAICAGLLASTACASHREPNRETPVFANELFAMRLTRGANIRTAKFRAPADSTWRVLPPVVGALGFPRGRGTNDAERLFITEEMTIQRQLYDGEPNSLYLNCGRSSAGSEVADDYVVVFRIVARVVTDGDTNSHVDLFLDGRARDRTQSNMSAVFCTGRGRLEQMIFDALRKRLPA